MFVPHYGPRKTIFRRIDAAGTSVSRPHVKFIATLIS
jgi:hypothetical protein